MAAEGSLAILVIGILAALTGLQNLPENTKKHWFLRALFFGGIGLQIVTQGYQYHIASENLEKGRKEAEREVAFQLYSLIENDVELLKSLKTGHYQVGYRLFRNGQADLEKGDEKGKELLDQA